MYCKQCGNQVLDNASVCIKCGVATGYVAPVVVQQPYVHPYHQPCKQITFVLLGLFLGMIGIHNFYAGYTGRGVAQLLITLFTFWLFFPLLIVGIWVIVEICTVNADSKGVPFV